VSRPLAVALLVGLALAPTAAGQKRGNETIHHVVETGESLWSIAALTQVYDDPYLWPVIYRFNRDQIVDPAQIYPEQVLQIPILVDEQARREAHSEAGRPD
jgi:nucleoid-associated protein YgaU